MAQLTGTSDTYLVGSAGGIREDLEDTIWDLFPEDTWALTNLDKVTATNTFHEWLADTPAAAAANLQLEGDDASFADITPAVRYGNYCQISRKTFLISGSLETVKKAGRRSEVARQKMKKMIELKRDMEFALTRNQIGTAGGAGTARSSAGMEAWIGGTFSATTTVTNVVATTSTSSHVSTAVTSGAPGTAIVDGTNSFAMTEGKLQIALEAAWTDGGASSTILVSPTQKKVIDAFSGITTRFSEVRPGAQASIVGAANIYVSDFGNHTVVLHRYMRTNVALCLDPSLWAVGFLRRPFTEQLAKTGDGTKHQMLAEFCLVSRNWQGNAKVVGM